METNEEVQRFTGNVIVTSIERPKCTMTISPELCPSWSLNTANCSKHQWTAIARIDFQDTELGSLTHDGGDGIVMTYDSISEVLSGPIQANISGDCCISMLTINALDKDGYIAQCNLDLSGGKPIEPAEQVQEPATEVVPVVHQKIFSETFAILVAAMTCFVLIFIVIFVTIIALRFSRVSFKSKERRALKAKISRHCSRNQSNTMATGYDIEWY